MPPKVRELIKILEQHGFINRGGKGSHRNYTHHLGINITISGSLGNDAKPYQEKAVKKAIRELKNEKRK